MFLCQYFGGAIMKSTTVLYPLWKINYNLNDTVVSVIYSLFLGGFQIGGVSAAFVQKYKKRKVFFISSFICFICLLSAAFVTNVYLLALAYFCAAFGIGNIFTLSLGYGAATFAPEIRSLAISIGKSNRLKQTILNPPKALLVLRWELVQ